MLREGILSLVCIDIMAWRMDIIGGNYGILIVIRILENLQDGV